MSSHKTGFLKPAFIADFSTTMTANQSQITRELLEAAGADARWLMANSPIISKLLGVEVVARQLFLLVRNAFEIEIRENWIVEQSDLVIQTFGASAERHAVESPVTAKQLRDLLLRNVIPVIDVFCMMEEEDSAIRTE